MSSHFNPLCAVVLTALPVEYQAVRAHVTNLQEEVHPEGTVYERGTFLSYAQTWEIGLVETRMGTARAAFEAGRAIDYFKPSFVLSVGVAGGLKDVKIGDVVAATKVYGYESGKATAVFLPRPEIGNPTYSMVQRAQAEAKKSHWLQRINPLPNPEPVPQVYAAPIAAGEKVVASTRSATWEFLRQHYGDALAVEMEGYGFLQAVYGNQHVEALIVRGISDLIDKKSEADASGTQEIAARHASAFAFEVLAKMIQGGQQGSSLAKKKPPRTPSGTTYHVHQQTTSGPIISSIKGDINSTINHNYPSPPKQRDCKEQ